MIFHPPKPALAASYLGQITRHLFDFITVMGLNQTSFTFTVFFRKSFELIKSAVESKGRIHIYVYAQECDEWRSKISANGCVDIGLVNFSSKMFSLLSFGYCWHYVAENLNRQLRNLPFFPSLTNRSFLSLLYWDKKHKLHKKKAFVSPLCNQRIEMSHYLHERLQIIDEKLIESLMDMPDMATKFLFKFPSFSFQKNVILPLGIKRSSQHNGRRIHQIKIDETFTKEEIKILKGFRFSFLETTNISDYVLDNLENATNGKSLPYP